MVWEFLQIVQAQLLGSLILALFVIYLILLFYLNLRFLIVMRLLNLTYCYLIWSYFHLIHKYTAKNTKQEIPYLQVSAKKTNISKILISHQSPNQTTN